MKNIFLNEMFFFFVENYKKTVTPCLKYLTSLDVMFWRQSMNPLSLLCSSSFPSRGALLLYNAIIFSFVRFAAWSWTGSEDDLRFLKSWRWYVWFVWEELWVLATLLVVLMAVVLVEILWLLFATICDDWLYCPWLCVKSKLRHDFPLIAGS